MKVNFKDKTQLIWLIAIALTLAFIFGQSMLPASKSIETSDGVADTMGTILDHDAPSDENGDSVSDREDRPVIDFVIKYIRKIAHFIEHGILGLEIFFLLLAIEKAEGGETSLMPLRVTTLLFSLNMGVLAGFFDESIQILSGRTYSILDVWLDIAGYATFTAILTLTYVIIRAIKANK